MPQYLIELGNGYRYQMWAGNAENALAAAKKQAPNGVLVGGTDLEQATIAEEGTDAYFPDIPDVNGDYPGGGGGGGGGPSQEDIDLARQAGGFKKIDPADLRVLQTNDPKSAYQSGLKQRGYSNTGMLGRLLEQQFEPVRAIADIGNMFDPGDYDYETKVPGNIYGAASNLFDRIANPGIGDAGSTLSPGGSQRGWLENAGSEKPEDIGLASGVRSNFSNLARAAATDKWTPFAAQWLPSQSGIDRELDEIMYERSKFKNPSVGGIGQRGDTGYIPPAANLIDRLRAAFGI